MAIRNAKPVSWRPAGLSDAIDGSGAFPGAMSRLQNLIPAPHTRYFYIPRPGSTEITDFTGAGLGTPGTGAALLIVGSKAYGLIGDTSGTFSGKDVPFCYNIITATFETIAGITAGSLPTSQSNLGDWTPPTAAVIGSRIVFTHVGFAGGATKIGWLDISGFSDNTKTGDSHTTTTIDNLSANVLQAGWNVGDLISSSNGEIPAGTTIKSIPVGGLSLVLSAAATGSFSGSVFTVTAGTAAAPRWSAGDTNGNNLKNTPVAVANFNGRAYYAVPGAGMQFSDSGNATQITNVTQALTPQNGLDISAFGGLPYQQSAGGILQALIAFQGDAGMQQVTGDQALSTLALNAFGVGVGTLAPNSICQTPRGLAFVAPDGLRFIDFIGRLSDPVGQFGSGVIVPFVLAINPTRIAASFNQNVLRISVKNGNDPNEAVQEYWFDLGLNQWTGAHTFPAALIQPYQAASGVTTGHGFVMFASGIDGKLWNSEVQVSSSSSYTENGAEMDWIWEPVLLPDFRDMAMHAMIESTLGIVMPSTGQVAIQALDEAGNQLDSILVAGSGVPPTIWGQFKWGQALWGGGAGYFYQHPLNWNNPIVFKQATFQVNGVSQTGFAIGILNLRIQTLGYTTGASM